MSLKLAIFQDKEQVIAEIKELVDDSKPVGYVFTNPHRIYAEKQYLTEDDQDKSIQITLSPWILLSADREILIPKNQIVTIVEPIDSVKEMYSEKVNGSQSSIVSE